MSSTNRTKNMIDGVEKISINFLEYRKPCFFCLVAVYSSPWDPGTSICHFLCWQWSGTSFRLDDVQETSQSYLFNV